MHLKYKRQKRGSKHQNNLRYFYEFNDSKTSNLIAYPVDHNLGYLVTIFVFEIRVMRLRRLGHKVYQAQQVPLTLKGLY